MKKYRWNWKVCLSNLLFLLEILWVLYAVISTIQIIIFNLSADPWSHYSSWNMWLVLLRLFS